MMKYSNIRIIKHETSGSTGLPGHLNAIAVAAFRKCDDTLSQFIRRIFLYHLRIVAESAGGYDHSLCPDFQHFVNGVKKENPRYLDDQFSAIEEFLNEKDPDRATVAVVMNVCCENWRYRFSQFKQVYKSVEQGQITLSEYAAPMDAVQKQQMSVYQKAFDDRCRSHESEVTA